MAMKFRCVSTAQHNTPTDRPKRVGDIRQILWRCLRWRHGKTVKCNDKILMILDIQGTVIEESPSFCRSVENCRSLWRLNSGAWAPLKDTPTHRPTQQTNTQTATSGGATEPFGPAPFRRRRNPKFFTGPDVRANFREFSSTFRPSKLQSKREKKNN